MNIITRQVCQIEGDYNNRKLAELFYQKSGIKWEYELDDQEIGTDCSKIIPFNESDYPSLELLEHRLEIDNTIEEAEIHIVPIINYLRRKGVLPEMDFLFNVSF